MMRVLWSTQSSRSDRAHFSGGTCEASAGSTESTEGRPDGVGVADEPKLSSRGISPAP